MYRMPAQINFLWDLLEYGENSRIGGGLEAVVSPDLMIPFFKCPK